MGKAKDQGSTTSTHSPAKAEEFRRIPCRQIRRALVTSWTHLISESVSLVPRHCNKTGELQIIIKFPVGKNKREENANNSDIRLP